MGNDVGSRVGLAIGISVGDGVTVGAAVGFSEGTLDGPEVIVGSIDGPRYEDDVHTPAESEQQ